MKIHLQPIGVHVEGRGTKDHVLLAFKEMYPIFMTWSQVGTLNACFVVFGSTYASSRVTCILGQTILDLDLVYIGCILEELAGGLIELVEEEIYGWLGVGGTEGGGKCDVVRTELCIGVGSWGTDVGVEG